MKRYKWDLCSKSPEKRTPEKALIFFVERNLQK